MKMIIKAHTLWAAVSVKKSDQEQWSSYRHTMLKAMTKVAWKMLAIPSAKQRKMHNTPVLFRPSVFRRCRADVCGVDCAGLF